MCSPHRQQGAKQGLTGAHLLLQSCGRGGGGVQQPQLGCVWIASAIRNWQAVAIVWGMLALVRVPLCAHMNQRNWWVGKGVVLVALPLAYHSIMIPCFCGILDFFCKLHWLCCSLLLSLLRLSFHSSSLPGPCSRTHFPAPIPSL